MSSYFVRRNNHILGPLTKNQILELSTAERILDDDEIANDSTGPWSNAKAFLLDLLDASSTTSPSGGECLRTDSPPSIPTEPPPFEIDLSNIDSLPGNEFQSMSSSFDDWVSQEASDLKPARHSDWIAPLDLKSLNSSVETISETNKSGSEPNRIVMPAGKWSLLCIGVGTAFLCLFAVIAVVAVSRALDKK